MHGFDNIELLYKNKDLPGFPVIVSSMATIQITLYANTAHHEPEGFVGDTSIIIQE